MSEIIVRKVEGKKYMDDFIRVPQSIYQHCPQYVPDLESDVRKLFDAKENPGLEFSDIQPFVAYRQDVPVGRVVGIVNRKANKCWDAKNVRFSMIEFIDDKEVSKALLQTVEAWGRERGMDTMQGPLGITDFDKEGMLVEDFDLLGSINTIYNPEYYPRHMEALGLEKEVDWLQVHIDIPKEVPARYARVAQYAREQIGLRVIKLTEKQISEEGYGHRVFDLLNEAYKPIFGAISMGSLSKSMQKAHGKLLPFGWYYLLKALKWHHEDNAEMLLIAIRPDYQGLGVNAMFFDDLIPIFNRFGFKWAETGPQLEDNVRELSQWKPLHPKFVKRRRCYKKKI